MLLIFSVVVAVVNVLPVQAIEPLIFESSVTRTSVLELYTSEGCSSCPPVEEWFSKLKENTGTWNYFVPVAFHVDYWDYLGWKDPYGSKKYSVRQSLYSNFLKTEPYTPELVLNGREWRIDSSTFGSPSEERVGVLRVTRLTAEQYLIDFDPTDVRIRSWDVHAALQGMDLVSQVTAGENRDKTLKHDFVVLELQEKQLELTSTHYTAIVKLEITNASLKSAAPEALAVWVTKKNEWVPMQAVGGFLSKS